jgi:hypothetical protein
MAECDIQDRGSDSMLLGRVSLKILILLNKGQANQVNE